MTVDPPLPRPELDPPLPPEELYRYLPETMNRHRPLFTGDIFDGVDIAGVGRQPAISIEHPCFIRGYGGALSDQMVMAALASHQPHPEKAWREGFYNRMPLPGLPLGGDFHVAIFNRIGLAETVELTEDKRVACLSVAGINQLQQRLVCHLTRVAVPTRRLNQAFEHTYEEANLAEEWHTRLHAIEPDAAAAFDAWMGGGSPSLRDRLERPSERAGVWSELHNEIRLRGG